MAIPSQPDKYAAARAWQRYHRAGRVLHLAAQEHPRRVLEYGLSHDVFSLAELAANSGLRVTKLYPYTGRMLKLGMIAKSYPRHNVIEYSLTPEGRLVANCLRELAASGRRCPQHEEE